MKNWILFVLLLICTPIVIGIRVWHVLCKPELTEAQLFLTFPITYTVIGLLMIGAIGLTIFNKE